MGHTHCPDAAAARRTTINRDGPQNEKFRICLLSEIVPTWQARGRGGNLVERGKDGVGGGGTY